MHFIYAWCLEIISGFTLSSTILQGVKVSLSAAAVSGTTSLDLDVLHLTWTTENLQQQLDVIDQRCEV